MADIVTAIDNATSIIEDLDIMWLLFGTVLVFFMQTGFAMLEVGSVSIRNTKNILIKNIMDASIGAIVWWLIGYALAYGDDATEFIAYSGFAMKQKDFIADDGSLIGAEYASWIFQWAFAATATTIVSGAIAERVTLLAYVIYSVTITGFIYPVVVHWTWNTGFMTAFRDDPLAGCGVVDFAGSGVVHMTGGIAAFVAAFFIGPRTGRFSEDGTPNKLPRQSAVLQTLGALILWFGWYGFNGVSTLAIVGFGTVAGKTMVTTTISAAAGALSCVFIGRIADPVIDSSYANNGIISGLVAITAPCSVVTPESAFIIGVIGAGVYYAAEKLLEKLKVDDVVNASPAHGFVGAWGVISVGFFSDPATYAAAYYTERADDCGGIFTTGNGTQLGVNIAFVLLLVAWVGGTSTILFGAMHYFGILRVSKDVEAKGLDASKHGGVANTGISMKG